MAVILTNPPAARAAGRTVRPPIIGGMNPDLTAPAGAVLDHIGIAVADLEAALKTWNALGLIPSGEESVAGERVRVAFLPVGGAARVELLSPTSPDSPIAAFLQKRGPGVHHLCFKVPDLEAAIAELRGRGFLFVGDAPRPGAGGARVAFLHPRSMGGVLVELTTGH